MGKNKALSERELDAILQNWNGLAEHLKTAPLEHVVQLLEHELKHRRRSYMVKRLFTRKSSLQSQKELEVLLGTLEK